MIILKQDTFDKSTMTTHYFIILILAFYWFYSIFFFYWYSFIKYSQYFIRLYPNSVSTVEYILKSDLYDVYMYIIRLQINLYFCFSNYMLTSNNTINLDLFILLTRHEFIYLKKKSFF